MAYYIVKQKGDETERLVECRNTAGARNHVAKETITVSVATPADLLRLGAAGVTAEKASVDAE